jgi:hypothetical protein
MVTSRVETKLPSSIQKLWKFVIAIVTKYYDNIGFRQKAPRFSQNLYFGEIIHIFLYQIFTKLGKFH